jgi:hypothetical protein
MSNKNAAPVTFRASVALMDDYRLGTEITAQTDITQVVNELGEGELFYTGIDDKREIVIYNVFPDSDSDTGWEVVSIVPDFNPGQLVGGVANGVFTLFCVGPDTSNPDIHYSQRDNKGNWSAWRSIDASSVFTDLVPPVYVRKIATGIVSGKLELATVLTDANGQMSLWRVDWSGTLGKWEKLGSVDAPFLDFCATLNWGEGVLGAVSNQTMPTAMDLTFFPISGGTPAIVAAQQYFRLADSSLVTPAGSTPSYSGVFLYNDGLSGGSKTVSFIDCSLKDPRPVVIDATLSCEQIVAVDAGANPITFMALDQHMRLNVISREETGGAWSRAIELGEVVSSITAGLAANGAPLVFAVNAQGNTLYSMLKQPSEQGGEWTKQQIEAQVQKMQQLAVYGTVFTLMDATANLLPNQTVQVTSPETTVIAWRDQSFVIGEKASATLTTDSNGRVVIYAPTGTINSNKLVFSVPGLMNTGDAIVIDPDVHVQEQLKNLSLADTTKLLPDQYKKDAAQVQKAVNTVMSYTPMSTSKTKGARLVAAAARTADYHRPLDPKSGAVQHWHFAVRDGRATFKELTAEEARILKEQLIAGASGKPANLNGLFDFLGDIVDAVSNGVQTAFDYVVSTVGGVISAVINCVINGAHYVFNGVIDTIERVFQIAEAILNAVMVFFKQLYDFLAWILTSARQDIWNTKKQFEQALNQAPPTLISLAETAEEKIGTFFADLKKDIAARFDAIIAAYGSTNFTLPSTQLTAVRNTTTELNNTQDIINLVYEAEVKAMWLLEKIFSPLNSSSFNISSQPQVEQAMKAFYDAANTQIGEDIQQQITVMTDYLQSIATNPGNFAASTVKVFLQTAKNLILLVLDIVDGLAKMFFETAIALLNGIKQWVFDQPISGFFLQELYDLINPEGSEQLTLVRLISLTCAFPTTILYRIITGHSPYTASTMSLPNENRLKEGMGGLMLVVYTAVDMIFDLDGEEPEPNILKQLMNFMAFTLPVLIEGYLCPGDNLFTLKTAKTTADTLENISWSTHMCGTGWMFISGFCNRFATNPRKDWFNCVLVCCFGFIELALAIGKRVESPKQGGVETFIDVVDPLSSIVKPLRFVKHPIAKVVMGVVDIVSDFGQGIGHMYLSVTESECSNKNKGD